MFSCSCFKKAKERIREGRRLAETKGGGARERDRETGTQTPTHRKHTSTKIETHTHTERDHELLPLIIDGGRLSRCRPDL